MHHDCAGSYAACRTEASGTEFSNLGTGVTKAMLTHRSPRIGASQSIDLGCPTVGSRCVFLAIISIVIGIEVWVLAAWSGAFTPSLETVNRKSDRLPLVGEFHSEKQPLRINFSRMTGPRQELPDGCESLASPLARSSVAHIAGRCVS
jgi:hypothetical protein